MTDLDPAPGLERVEVAPLLPPIPIPRFELAKGIALFAIYFGLQVFLAIVFLIGVAVVASLAGHRPASEAEIQGYLPSYASLLVLFTLVPTGIATLASGLWLGRGHLRSGAANGYGLVPASPRHLLWAAAVGAGCAGLYVLTATWVPVPPPEPGSLSELAVGTPFDRLVWLFAALIFAPPVEEVVFRGGLLAGFRSRLGRGWSFALTTALFGALHLTEVYNHWPAIVVVFGLAWLLAELRDRTGSLWPPMLAHFVYNATLSVAAELS
jgi:membrane protease YdiL (CAAX protease family)